MGDRIYFKDASKKLQGPFTEHQVQEWYRKELFKSSFQFYFTRSNETPLDKDSDGITLEILQSLNGVESPFSFPSEFKIDQEAIKEVDKKEQGNIEEEISGLNIHGDRNTSIAKPNVPEDVWHKFYELGNTVADFVMDAFGIFESGDFDSWDKNRVKNMESTLDKAIGREKIERNIVLQHILEEKMKKKEIFCCEICKEAYFNYKHALIHFTSEDHVRRTKDFPRVYVRESNVVDVKRVLDSFTKLPQTLFENDRRTELERSKRSGSPSEHYLRLQANFMTRMKTHYLDIVRPTALEAGPARILRFTMISMERLKCDLGREAMAELHKIVGMGATYCPYCYCITGDRDEFYAHCESYFHMKNYYNYMRALQPDSLWPESIGMLIKIHKEDVSKGA